MLKFQQNLGNPGSGVKSKGTLRVFYGKGRRGGMAALVGGQANAARYRPLGADDYRAGSSITPASRRYRLATWANWAKATSGSSISGCQRFSHSKL